MVITSFFMMHTLFRIDALSEGCGSCRMRDIAGYWSYLHIFKPDPKSQTHKCAYNKDNQQYPEEQAPVNHLLFPFRRPGVFDPISGIARRQLWGDPV
jgi:hypothetical protein